RRSDVLPIAAFVAAGFEHSIANIYFISIGFFLKTGTAKAVLTAVGQKPPHFSKPKLRQFFIRQLLPVTIGHVIRRVDHGRGRLLVRLFAKEIAAGLTIAGTRTAPPPHAALRAPWFQRSRLARARQFDFTAAIA